MKGISLIARLRRSSSGQSLIEFGMVLPFLLVVGFIITEFGRALWVQNVLTEAAGNGARAAIVSSTATYQQVAETAANRILDANKMGTAMKVGPATVTSSLVDLGGGDTGVRVRVTREFSFIPGSAGKGSGLAPDPFAKDKDKIPLGTFTIAGEAVMQTQPGFN